MKKILKKIGWVFLAIFLLGLLIPQNLEMPVVGATNKSYDKDTFCVLVSSKINKGGNIILILGPKWRVHYYAHLDELTTSHFSLVSKKIQIGTVGDSGNAKGKPPHLHYSIATIIPYFWRK